MALKDIIRVFMYVDPTTGKADKMTCFTPFGMTERINADWQPSSREESGVDELSDHKIYALDWDTDFLPMDAEDDGREHMAVELFDKGELDEAACQKYGQLYVDPAAADEDNQEILEELRALGEDV